MSSDSNTMSNDSINWIDNAITEMHIKYFDYKFFRNIEEIGKGGFGKIYRANWKNMERHLVLKSLLDMNPIAVKELAHELKLHRDVDFHDNIISFYGITQENSNDKSKSYLLVMEYADGGTLQNYLENNFFYLNWKHKYNMASELASAVLCLHDEGIIHRDLHSCNVLVRNHTVKLADFGLSRRIDEASKSTALFGVIPYIDPKRFGNINNNEKKKQIYKLNEKSDVYGIGVLLWVISSGQQPFGGINNYNLDLIMEISKGLRETPIPHTPREYVNIYTECWNGEPEKRPTMQQVVAKLKTIRSTTDTMPIITPMCTSPIHGDLSLLMDKFDQMTFESNGSNDSTNIETTNADGVGSTNIETTNADGVGSINMETINTDSISSANIETIKIPFPPQITAEEVLDRSKYKERKKAPNNFMIYRLAYAKELKSQNISNLSSYSVSALAALKWNNELDEVKQAYKDISDKVQSKLDEIRTSRVYA
ncbi:kinase-like domain-containing protein [Rhizophagus diaphanus]|nr:kinase-like domain-containing protein [Rhizophagus diaphanus] [Rhizophagus sp. MUCL 43196]